MKRKVFGIPKSKKSGIYMLYNLNKHKAYIGKTLNFYSRAKQHQSLLLCGSHSNKAMQKDFNAGDEFYFVILKDMGACCERDELLFKEKQYILTFKEKIGSKTYNHETKEQLIEHLVSYMIRPTINNIQNELRQKLQCHLLSLERCKADTLKEKFRAINETMERDNE